jgi:hypothetical protein
MSLQRDSRSYQRAALIRYRYYAPRPCLHGEAKTAKVGSVIRTVKQLAKHRAAPKCQFDAFAEFVAAAEAQGVESYPLYSWTKANDRGPDNERRIFEVIYDLRGRPRGLCQGDC